jgi:hypothetical protein
MKNFSDTQQQPWSQLGFAISPTAGPGGVTNTPVVFTFFALGIGTQHFITIGTNTYLYTEPGGQTSAQLATAMSTGAVTNLGLVITDDPNIALSVGSNQITLSPGNDSGIVIPLSASDSNAATQLWVTTNPTSTVGATQGFTDILISPVPTSSMLSMHNIGMSNGKLRFGARSVRVSQSFVSAQVNAQNLTDQNLVWRGPQVLGLISENLLMSIEIIKHIEIAGQSIVWDLWVNCSEIR